MTQLYGLLETNGMVIGQFVDVFIGNWLVTEHFFKL